MPGRQSGQVLVTTRGEDKDSMSQRPVCGSGRSVGHSSESSVAPGGTIQLTGEGGPSRAPGRSALPSQLILRDPGWELCRGLLAFCLGGLHPS